jgi:GT2 family glycosyltransferase
MPAMTIGFVPRDRFCKAPESLASILERTAGPYELFVSDPGIPQRFREPLERLLEGREDTRIISMPATTTSNAARNRVVEQATSEFVCLIENDCMVYDGWLDNLLRACQEHPADMVVPLLLEPRGTSDKVHFDDRLGSIQQLPNGQLEILPRATSLETDRAATRHAIDFVEMHCLFFRRSVFDRIGGFDETQRGSRAEVDLSLALWTAGVRMVLAPDSRVLFSAPPPVFPEEREHYLRYWDLDASAADHRVIEERWNLVECPSAIGFVKGRRRIVEEPAPELQVRQVAEQIAAVDRAAAELSRVIPAGESLILVDEAQWVAEEIAGDRKTIPFLERDGQYWGSPADDDTAIREFERLRLAGANFIAFGWPAFWWLDHYRRFHEHLRSQFPCVLSSERLVIFDLKSA